jgi:hypothetical protein
MCTRKDYLSVGFLMKWNSSWMVGIRCSLRCLHTNIMERKDTAEELHIATLTTFSTEVPPLR